MRTFVIKSYKCKDEGELLTLRQRMTQFLHHVYVYGDNDLDVDVESGFGGMSVIIKAAEYNRYMEFGKVKIYTYSDPYGSKEKPVGYKHPERMTFCIDLEGISITIDSVHYYIRLSMPPKQEKR